MKEEVLNKWKKGFGDFLEDPIGHYQESIERSKELIERYKKLIKKHKLKIVRLKALVEIARLDDSTWDVNLDRATNYYEEGINRSLGLLEED